YVSSDLNYIKTEYDKDGNIMSGTHSGGYVYGNSLLILGAKQKIQQIPVDINNNEKLNYDLGKNDNVVRYKIEPSIYQDIENKSEVKDITVTITDTLPKGLT